AAAALGARRPELRLGGPRIGVAVTAVERVDVLEDHVSGVGHLVSDVVVGSAILSEARRRLGQKQGRRQASLRNTGACQIRVGCKNSIVTLRRGCRTRG